MLVRIIREARLEAWPFLIQGGLVRLVVSRPRYESMNLGVLEGATESHFLNESLPTSLPLPKEKPLCSYFLNSEASS